MKFTPTPDQQEALAFLMDRNILAQKHLTLGGYAGTGKTTLLSVWRQIMHKKYPKLRVAFCAFTGKASQVLQLKLCEQDAMFEQDKVSTIHSLIYAPRANSKGQIYQWERRPYIEADIIVVDEASMVSQAIWQDLQSFQIPIIAVGDHGQLPPIGESFSLMQEPVLKLEKIHRQAALSPIIQVSIQARETGIIPLGKAGKGVVKISRSDPDVHSIIQSLLEDWNEDTMFLVGMNWTRIKLNKQIRTVRGIESDIPAVGDRVICLKNNWREGIYNGMLGNIRHLKPKKDNQGNHHWYDVDIALDDGQVYEGTISKHQFESPTTLTEVDGLSYTQMGDLFDYGYALTVHKAQGSQASKVVVFEERNKHMDDEQWRRWLYTAVTRAEKELIIIGD